MTHPHQPPTENRHSEPAGGASAEAPTDALAKVASQTLDSVGVGVVCVDRELRITFANQFARKMLQLMPKGIPAGGLADFEPYSFLPNGERFKLEDYPAVRCLRTNQAQPPTTMGLRRTTGEVHWVTITAIPITDPVTQQAESAVATFIDISHTRQIEEALEQSEDRYRRLVEDAPDAIVVHCRGTIKFANDAAVRLWGGKSRNDFLGMHVMQFVHPDFHETIRRRVERVATGETVPMLEHLNLRLDGRTVAVESTAMPCIFNGQECVQVILRDVTQRKADQEALRHAKDELEERVKQRTEEISHKNDELKREVGERRRAESKLQERQRTLKRLLGVHERERQLVAYEMHDTFLQDVIGALMFVDSFYEMRRDAGEQGLENIEQSRQLLRKAITEARQMISGLRPPIIDEQGIIAAIDYLISELRGRGLEVVFNHSMRFDRLTPALEETIFRVVQEALSNVERHSGQTSAEVTLRQSADMLDLQVVDKGAGFAQDDVSEGHFGLEGMRERARSLGAELIIKSAPGKGTRITMRLPLTPSGNELPSAM